MSLKYHDMAGGRARHGAEGVVIPFTTLVVIPFTTVVIPFTTYYTYHDMAGRRARHGAEGGGGLLLVGVPPQLFPNRRHLYLTERINQMVSIKSIHPQIRHLKLYNKE